MVIAIAGLHLSAQQTPGFGTYGYDGAGNVTAVGNDAFVYDELGRIRKASLLQGGTAHVQEFTYDRYGNIRSITTSGDSTPAIPAVDPATNRINFSTSTTNVFGRYDAAGNLTRFNEVDHFQYDALNVMTESTVDMQRRVYLYNASNERIATLKVAGQAIIGSEWTLRDASAKVLRRLSKDAAGVWRWDEDYIYRGSQLLAAEVPGNTLHFHLDHLGTPRVITGNGGARISAHTYYPFGRELTPPGGERMKFTGHERDAINLDYMHARSYLPWTGRFLSVDPTWESADLGKPQSWNRYSYVMNNPVNATDPDGRVWNLLTPLTFRLGLNHPKSPEVRQLEKAALATAVIVLAAVVTRGEILFGPSAGEPEPTRPSEAYDRQKHYGRTPTAKDRKDLGAGSDEVVNHEPPLVKRYYEGDPATGEKPGHQMTPEERRDSATDRRRMNAQPKKESCQQGADCAQYSKEKKKEYQLDPP